MSTSLNSAATRVISAARRRSNALLNGRAKGRIEKSDAVSSPAIATTPLPGEISPRPARRPKMKRQLPFTALPTIFDNVVLQIPPRPIEPNPHNPQIDQFQSVEQPVFDPATNTSSAPQEWVEQHAACLDMQNDLWTRINDAETQLGDMRREMLDTKRQVAALRKAHSALQREMEIRTNQGDAGAAPLSPPEEQTAYL